MDLILASASPARARCLSEAGIVFCQKPSSVDEGVLKSRYGVGEESALAVALAEEKALAVSKGERGALVLGGDQVMVCEGRRVDKSGSVGQAREDLAFLCGKSHALYSGCALAQSGEVVWSGVEKAVLSVRSLRLEEQENYLALLGEAALSVSGIYQLERGAYQIFSEIRGEYTAIMGLPMLLLLPALRKFAIKGLI